MTNIKEIHLECKTSETSVEAHGRLLRRAPTGAHCSVFGASHRDKDARQARPQIWAYLSRSYPFLSRRFVLLRVLEGAPAISLRFPSV